MNRHQLLITISALLWFSCYNLQDMPAQVNPASKEFMAVVDSIFADRSDMNGPGASVIIIKGSDVVFSKKYGTSNLPFSVPFSENTTFPLPNFTD